MRNSFPIVVGPCFSLNFFINKMMYMQATFSVHEQIYYTLARNESGCFGACVLLLVTVGMTMTHLAEEMLQEAVQLLLLVVGEPHTGWHVISCGAASDISHNHTHAHTHTHTHTHAYIHTHTHTHNLKHKNSYLLIFCLFCLNVF